VTVTATTTKVGSVRTAVVGGLRGWELESGGPTTTARSHATSVTNSHALAPTVTSTSHSTSSGTAWSLQSIALLWAH
jgi:hypothetical protein